MKKSDLSEYHKKRNFKKTTEPPGRVSSSQKKKLIFVVQEHHARRLHYDFRLELNGVLKSWAIPKGPSLDPQDKRLAIQTEDHPFEYARFHGTIPKGEYGAGKVTIWDKGTWEPEGDPEEGLTKGHLKFELFGKKLKGSFVLVRTHYKDQDHNWLLIKHKDDYWPGFIPPALPRLVSKPPVDEGWIHEIKFDGYRMQAQLHELRLRLFTRSGLDWTSKFPQIAKELEKLKASGFIIDGEIISLDEKGRGHFQNLQNALKKKSDETIVYYAFDLLYLNGEDLRSLPLLERKKALKKLLKGVRNTIRYTDHFAESGKDIFQLSCEHQLEGIVSKRSEAPYQSGRNDGWLKTKCSSRQEFVIGGWSDPRGGRQEMGALLLGVYDDDKKLRYAGRVGSGFNRRQLGEIQKELQLLETHKSPFQSGGPQGAGFHWVKPVKVCEVSFSNWTREGILRTPVFMGMREDKPPREIIHEKSHQLSSPDKVIFSKEKITKQKISQFYQEIAQVMLPYLKDRPLSLVRCPEGTEGSCFYQKHISGRIPSSFQPVTLQEGHNFGDYLTINSVQGLKDLVQLSALELHAWNCRRGRPLCPDQVVMDLDPGEGVPWKKVVEAAIELKNLLLDLELESFVKLTGGKGLHLHIPIAPIYDWDQVKSFAQTLARELVARSPEKYVATMSKKVRTKKIFIDYFRNGRGATAVVPYSLRAKVLSAVALPLGWNELKKMKRLERYSMAKALKKIKGRRKDPWEGMLDLRQEILILKPVCDKKTNRSF